MKKKKKNLSILCQSKIQNKKLPNVQEMKVGSSSMNWILGQFQIQVGGGNLGHQGLSFFH